ncbi:right-handed parallel beta-helix repeat-containing protein [Bremerella cremea]|uniref:right-handed parallel beta-helix repeat-containing protein n=1 Tax=Bremerella cremea TaxID=1031537 RepID=UPI0031EE5395
MLNIVRTFRSTGSSFAVLLLLLSVAIVIVSVGKADSQNSVKGAAQQDVFDFDVVGDGRHDDTVGLQQWLDAGRPGMVLPKGEYKISKPLVIELDKVGVTSIVGDGTARIVMAGAGPAIRLIGTHEGTASPKTVKFNVWLNQRMPIIQGIEIVGAHEEADGIEALKTMQLTISQVAIRNTRHAIHLVERNRNVIIANCHLYQNRGAGVFLDDVDLHQINISASHISYNQGGGVISKGGGVRNLHISGSDLEANVQNVLIDSAGSAWGTAEVSITGCTLQHSEGENSANVRFIGATPHGEPCWGLVSIANNILSDVETNIDIRQARDVSIVGNTIGSGYKYNLRVEDSMNVVVGANVLARNPPYRDRETCDNAVLFKNCDGGTITGLHIRETLRADAGLMLEKCRRFHVTGCTVLDCENAGLKLTDLEECEIHDNMVLSADEAAKDWQPIIVTGGRKNRIER